MKSEEGREKCGGRGSRSHRRDGYQPPAEAFPQRGKVASADPRKADDG